MIVLSARPACGLLMTFSIIRALGAIDGWLGVIQLMVFGGALVMMVGGLLDHCWRSRDTRPTVASKKTP